MLVWRRHIQVQGVHCLTPALLRSGFIDGGWPASTLRLDRSPAPSDVAAWRDADGASAGSGRGRTGCRRADWSRPRRQTSRDAARSSQSGYKRHPDVRSALAAADGSNLEDLDEHTIDTRGPPANAAFALPEVLDGLAHAAAGKARKAYNAFDRHYGTARWVLRFVEPVVSVAVFFAVFVSSGLRADDLESTFGCFLMAAIAVGVFERVITTLARTPSDIKAEDEAALMARFAASAARTVNKFLDSIPSSRDLTSLQGFAVWCIQARGWDLSDKAPALLEARWLRKSFVMAWARPLFEAFAAGCWLIYWMEDTLYWCAKPVVHRDRAGWFHDDRHAAVESEVEELYFWHGVRVPAFVVLRPDRITVGHIDREANAEVRRVMVERYRHGEEVHGAAAFIRDAGAVGLDHDERYGTLWRRNV
jgi:hypothetical protein